MSSQYFWAAAITAAAEAASRAASIVRDQAPLFPVNGLVYVMIRSALSYSDTQAQALWEAALALAD
jgi:hypothetical protein